MCIAQTRVKVTPTVADHRGDALRKKSIGEGTLWQ
jgi:hypothetical protein